jgi:hypothetical protein
MEKNSIATASGTGAEAAFRIDLPLDPGTLNERLFDIGVWLIERDIPHRVHIFMEPRNGRIRISFPDADVARAFGDRFGQRLDA